MDVNPYMTTKSSMPDTVAIFPLSGVLLLPHGNLPLNIFEPRYIAMIDDAMSSSKLIGMIQRKEDESLYHTGCVGKITEYRETTDGRYLISLTGICRFHVIEELETTCPYRIVKPDWKEFDTDVQIPKSLGVDREKLLNMLCRYFKMHDMSCNFDKFETIPDSRLITTLAMVCPFDPSEKQAILEQICHIERAKTFMTMLEMAVEDKSLDRVDKKRH